MTDPTTPATGEEQAAHDAAQRKERAARGCLLVVALAAGGAIAVTIPETAYYAAGLGTAAAIRKTHHWITRHREQQPEEQDVVDIVAALHELSPGGTQNVRLTQLQDHAGLPNTLEVKSLLADAGITPRGVRAGGRNGPGVHATDIPRTCGAPIDGCWCAVTSNNNTNNTPTPNPEEGLRVQDIGEGARVYTNPAETVIRHHAITK